MNIVEMGEKVAREIDDRIDGSVVSAVVYGTEIHGDVDGAKDCNMVLVLDKVGLKEIKVVHEVVLENMADCTKTPLVVDRSEIEGMEDSVPSSFLDVLSSYQTVYGKSLFKGLSTINHEHLRAQVEQRIRESLFSARTGLVRGYEGGKRLDQEIIFMKNLFKRSLHLYLLLKKPWVTNESEKWDAFLDDFNPENIWLRNYFNKDPVSMSDDEKRNLASAIVEDGIKPLMVRVDESGPK